MRKLKPANSSCWSFPNCQHQHHHHPSIPWLSRSFTLNRPHSPYGLWPEIDKLVSNLDVLRRCMRIAIQHITPPILITFYPPNLRSFDPIPLGYHCQVHKRLNLITQKLQWSWEKAMVSMLNSSCYSILSQCRVIGSPRTLQFEISREAAMLAPIASSPSSVPFHLSAATGTTKERHWQCDC